MLSSDKTSVFLTIDKVASRHYGNYTLRAVNMVGSAMATVIMSRGVGKKSSSGGDVLRGRPSQRDADNSPAGTGADDGRANSDHFRPLIAPSTGHRHSQYSLHRAAPVAPNLFTQSTTTQRNSVSVFHCVTSGVSS